MVSHKNASPVVHHLKVFVDLYIGGRIKANESSFDRRSNGVKIHLKNSNADDEALLKKNNISYTVGW